MDKEVFNMMKMLMDESAIKRSLIRMTHEIIEHNKGLDRVVLLGIETRGATLAFRMAELMREFEGVSVPVASLNISYWRDDRKSSDQVFRLPISVQDRIVVIVDDVLFSGRSARAAMDGIVYNGRPQAIQLACLVDRGHRELPIRADFVGKNIPTSYREVVVVKLNENDDEESVNLL